MTTRKERLVRLLTGRSEAAKADAKRTLEELVRDFDQLDEQEILNGLGDAMASMGEARGHLHSLKAVLDEGLLDGRH